MTTFSEIEQRQLADRVAREVINKLTYHAADPVLIGKRVIAWQYRFTAADRRAKLITLARRLGVSVGRASIAVSNAQAAIREVQEVKLSSNTQADEVGCDYAKTIAN